MTSTPKILVVEDSPTQALRLQWEMEAQGWSVTTAANAEEALKEVERITPDIMIVDYCLPGISGDELCRRIRMNINTRGIPIIMLTADDHEDTEVRGLDSGADDFFKKAADLEILVLRVRSMLERPRDTQSILADNDQAFRRANILAVDDSATYLSHLTTILQSEGYSVQAVTDPHEAIQRLSESSYDLALVDLIMPGLDGIELCRKIVTLRSNLDNPIAVLMLTGREAKEDLTRALEAGADDFVGKSSDHAVLKGRIRALLRRKFFQEENRRILDQLKNKELEAITARAEKEAALARAADERRRHAESVANELQQAKENLEASNQELLRSNDELRQFAYVASHDLQEPLRTITSYCNILKEDYAGRLDFEADQNIEYIVQGAARMKSLINALLSYSRVTRDEHVAFGRVDFLDVVQDALANLKCSIQESGAEVTWSELPIVNGDRVQLAELVQNLVGNAILYRGNSAPKIQIAANRQDSYWEISVRDNGIGIAPEHHQQVFEIFKRLHNRSKYPGTGIGLAICRKIAQRHGGQMRIESQLGQGGVFYFTIYEPGSTEKSNEPYTELAATV
jgi:DNA-binding response OmpR family regulator/anti-sigma regulatory factor (Ser/Thr protein kinase)